MKCDLPVVIKVKGNLSFWMETFLNCGEKVILFDIFYKTCPLYPFKKISTRKSFKSFRLCFFSTVAIFSTD